MRGGSGEKIFVVGAVALALAYLMKKTTGISVTGNYSDQVKRIAQAIATAEGFGKPNVLPTLRNNPGDLTESDGAGGWRVRTFATVEDGWSHLYAYVQRMIDGTGHYNTSMTWREIGRIYDGEAAYMNWVNNVTIALAVSPDSTLGEFVNA